MHTVVGFDIGHSSIKIEAAAANKKRVSLLIPSHACPAVPVDAVAGLDQVRRETVAVDGQDWFFGNTALWQGRHLPTGLSDDWIQTPEHTALFLGGLKALRDAGLPGVDDATIVLGLPGRTFSTQRHTLLTLLSQYAPGAKIHIVPQPAGPFYQAMFTEDGQENSQHTIEDEAWAIVEVGHFTTDTALFRHGQFISWAMGSANGVRVAAQELQRIVAAAHGVQIDLVEATESLQTRRIANFGNVIALDAEVSEAGRIIADQVIRHADQLLADEARKLTGVILAGGGAPLVYPMLKDHWPSTVMPHNPRFSVADGYYRYGRGLALLREQSEAKDLKRKVA
jgi:plasmid segregation protein ParM